MTYSEDFVTPRQADVVALVSVLAVGVNVAQGYWMLALVMIASALYWLVMGVRARSLERTQARLDAELGGWA